MAGLGVQPVEGRLDAMRLDGDPDATAVLGPALPGSGAGVLDGNPINFAPIIAIPLILLKRTPPTQLVRRP